MKLDFKKINFKQPKYMIPLLVLLPLLFIGYQVVNMLDFEAEPVEQAVQTETVNTDLPEITENKDNETKSKYQAMLDGYGKVTDYTAVNETEKEEEQKMLGWSAKRELSKINYRIHTDAIKSNLIPQEVTPLQASIIYAEEADVLNVAMFGMTAKQWRDANPELKGNIRDYATINELICLSNMENINAVLINEGIAQADRLVKLNQIAIQQMQVLEENGNRNLLK